MSRTIVPIEVRVLSYTDLRLLMNNTPAKHLEEVPFGNFQLELDLCDDVYNYTEHIGHSRCYAAFADDMYVGYMVVMASEMIHHKGTVQAVTDSFYVCPAYRSKGVLKALVSYIESDLAENGTRFLSLVGNPNMPNFEQFLSYIETMGYRHTESTYTKEL